MCLYHNCAICYLLKDDNYSHWNYRYWYTIFALYMDEVNATDTVALTACR